jgi:hypothetical protein
MKTLKESILSDIEDTLKSGDKFENFDLNTIMSAKSVEEFNSYVKMLKIMIESSCKGPISHKQLKKGKSYIYIWQDDWSENNYVICFVDKYPIQDPDDDLVENAYYDIVYDECSVHYDNVICHYDNTGNEFSNLLQQCFNGDTMKGAYEMPKEFFKSMKELIKNAESY